MPKVSVIIPTYNRSQKLIRALESVFAQTFQDYEVIVIDDGSKDDTRDRVKPYGDRLRYIYQENQGVSGARNHGILESQGQYLAFLDSDDEWLPKKLEKQMLFFDQYPEVSFLACLAEHDKDCVYKVPETSQKQFLQFLVEPFANNMTRYVVKKECFDKCGLFECGLQGPEDWEMWLRLLKQGYLFDYVPEPLIRYFYGEDSISRNPDKMLAGEMVIKQRYIDSLPGRWLRSKTTKIFLSRVCFSASLNYFHRGDRARAKEFVWKSLVTGCFGPKFLDSLKLWCKLQITS